MLNSICIKTNNKITISYILNELNNTQLSNVYFSCKKFKNYTNIIVHYIGNSKSIFISSLSKLLTYLVLDLYENKIIKNLIKSDYFYFSDLEQKTIYKICIDNLNNLESIERFKIIEEAIYKYLEENRNININGFIAFRLYKYFEYLNEITSLCINKFIIDKEYFEFINLLKSYVDSNSSNSNSIHLIYDNHESILLDENKNIIPIKKDAFNAPFLSDISFSSNDYTLNNLLSMLPSSIFIHILNESDEFIDTIKLIFDDRVHFCYGCDICKIFKNSSRNNSIVKLKR